VKLSDAPRAGWYPDPEGGRRLRWWDGSDWSDRYRSRPSATQPTPGAVQQRSGDDADDAWMQVSSSASQIPPATAAVVEQVRQAARAEAHLAAQEFERRARAITGSIPPLVSQYTNKFFRYLRILLVLSFIVLLAWFVWQILLQKSLFDWLGDRIDNLTDNGSSVVLTVCALSRW
jgi:hypothetical protein